MYSNAYSSFGGYSTASIGYAPKSDISYDTSSKDPVVVRSRVFVGNLNTSRVTRDDVIQLFRAYGSLTGVTLFKGYAFVQFANGSEADLCVSALNGYNWQGSILDVKLAGGSTPTTKASTNNFGAKQSKPEGSFLSKHALVDQVNNQNKTFCKNMAESISDLPAFVPHDSCPDTLICGDCRFITVNVQEYVEHRKKQCTFFKADGEPFKLQCFTCTEEFSDSWSLVRHLTSTHKLVLFKDPPANGDEEEAARNGALPAKEEEPDQ